MWPISSPARSIGTPCEQMQRGEDRSLFRSRSAMIFGVVGRAFGAAVPTVVVVGAVAIFFAVGFVVLVVVGDQVLQRESRRGR